MDKQPFNNTNAYAISVGVGKRDADNVAMATTAKDAKRIGRELIGRADFIPEKVQVLIDDDASSGNFLKALDNIAAATKDNAAEMVIIYFSGHGCIKNDLYYLVCRDSINEDIEHTAIAGSEFVIKLQAIQTDKLLILLDCCHAGGMYKASDIPFDKKDVLAKPNRVIIAASHVSQVSFVSKPLSIFTYALVEGLAGKYFSDGDQEVTLFGLAMYLRERVYPLSANKQKPQLNILQQGQTSDFTIVRYANGKPRQAAFDEDFSLMTADGKDIDVSQPIVRDDECREEYSWVVNNTGNNATVITGNSGSVIVKNVTQNAQSIVNIENIATGNFSF